MPATITVEQVKGYSVDELVQLGRFNLRLLATELGLCTTNKQRDSYMQLGMGAQAALIHVNIQQLKNVPEQFDLVQDCLAATTSENKRLGEENLELRALLDAANVRNVELTERLCALAERVANVGLAQLETNSTAGSELHRRKRSKSIRATDSNAFATRDDSGRPERLDTET